MDSGNSSSMQSSSGGDDQEYDSRSFFHHHTNIPPLPSSSHLLRLQSQPPQQPQPSDHPIPNFLQPDLFNWGAPASLLRPDPNTNYLSFTGADFAGPSTAPPPSTSAVPSASSPAPPLRQQPPKTPGPSKNPKKRTRASRRAPTTVLTTDTTNFRAMVQEFTGIPDPPFSSRRLDLFTTAGSSMRLAAATLGAPPFRPSAQRLPSAATMLGGVMNQDPLAGVGSGQHDPTSLAFERLIQQQPLLFPPPSNVNSSAFGISMGGLDPSGVGLGFGSSSSQPENNDCVMSCGALTSSSATDLAPPQGNADYRNQ